MPDEPREMQVHVVKSLIINHDGLTPEEIKDMVDNANYPNDCIRLNTLEVQTQTITDWTDEHPLNKNDQKAFDKLFPLVYDDDIRAAAIPPNSAAVIMDPDGTLRLAVPEMGPHDQVPRFVLFAAAIYRIISDMNEEEIDACVEQMAQNVIDSGDEESTDGLIDYLDKHMRKPYDADSINQDENNHYEDYEGEYDGQG